MKTKKEIFFKTVRRDGSSVHALPPLRRIYRVGKRYRFHPKTPAHVFRSEELGLRGQFESRAESNHGSRVLICWGKCYKKEVEAGGFTRIEVDQWEWESCLRESLTSCDFEVIGEIFPPKIPADGQPEWFWENAPSRVVWVLRKRLISKA